MGSLSNTPPPDLLKRAKVGDREALGELLEIFRNYLRLQANTQIRNDLQMKISPSDAVQEAYLRATANFDEFRSEEPIAFFRWLRRVFSSQILDEQRHYLTAKRDVRREMKSTRNTPSGVLGKVATPDDTPSQSSIRRERAVLLSQALEQLSTEERQIIIQRHVKGDSLAEIAAQMGCSVRVVRSRWSASVKRLRDLLPAEMT